MRTGGVYAAQCDVLVAGRAVGFRTATGSRQTISACGVDLSPHHEQHRHDHQRRFMVSDRLISPSFWISN